MVGSVNSYLLGKKSYEQKRVGSFLNENCAEIALTLKSGILFVLLLVMKSNRENKMD